MLGKVNLYGRGGNGAVGLCQFECLRYQDRTYNRRQEKQISTMVLRRRRICKVLRIQNGMATKARSVRIFTTSKKVQNAMRSIHLPSIKSHASGSPHLNAKTNTEENAQSPTRPPRALFAVLCSRTGVRLCRYRMTDAFVKAKAPTNRMSAAYAFYPR